MTDIVPALLDGIQKSFKNRVERDSRILRVNGRIRDGTATLTDAHVYSQRVGTALSNALREHITADTLPNGELYYNIADRVINPTLMENYELVNETAEDIQRIIDTKDGIGLGSVKAPFPQERVDGLIDKMTDSAIDIANRLVWLGEPIVNNSEAFFDDYVKENAAFRNGVGLKTTITRITAPGCCEWCSKMAGSYEYGEEPSDIYRRHEFCRCDVLFKSDKGVQDVWTKKTWSTAEELAKRRETRPPDVPTARERDAIIQDFMNRTGYDRRTAQGSTRKKTPQEIDAEIAKILDRQKAIRIRG